MAFKVKGNAIIPATVVTGRQIVQGPAIRIFNAAASPRKVEGGAAEPVIVVDEDDIVGSGGRYKVMSGPAIPMLNLSNRQVKGGPAIPVYPVDANGAYDSSFTGVETYSDKVVRLFGGHIDAYWRMQEAAGPTADNYEGTAARDGTYTGVTLGQPGIGDGLTSPFFDGANDYVNIYSASLNTAWAQGDSAVMIWAKVFPGMWTDGTARALWRLRADGNNYNHAIRSTTNNRMLAWVAGGAEVDAIGITTLGPLDWVCWLLTIEEGVSGATLYQDGVQVDQQPHSGPWVGNLSNTLTIIGAMSLAPGNVWHGWLAHMAVGSGAGCAAAIQAVRAELATV